MTFLMLLLFLPTEIWREHIFEFLALTNIVRGSSACADRQVQSQYRSLTDGLTLPSISVANGQSEKLRWCLARNILPSTFSVCGQLDDHTADILSKSCTRASSLSFIETARNFVPANCLRLKYLELHRCTLVSLGKLSVCPNLSVLSLSQCANITAESLLNSLTGCTALSECTITECELINPCATSHMLKHLTTLTSINFGRRAQPFADLLSVVEGCVLESAASTRIRQIALAAFCTVCRVGLQKLAAAFPLLQKLHLHVYTCTVTDADVNLLCKELPQLTDLMLQGFQLLTDVALESIVHHLILLQRLCVAYCTEISDDGVIAVAKGCAQLTGLDMSHCFNVTDKAVREVWVNCTQLRELGLGGCLRVTDVAFAERINPYLHTLDVPFSRLTGAFLLQMPQLAFLRSDQCPMLNSCFVDSLTKNPPSKLGFLGLNSTTLNVTDLLTLSTNLPYLERVRLSHSKVSDALLRSFVANCPKLRHMSLFSCEAVTRATVDELNRVYEHRLSISY